MAIAAFVNRAKNLSNSQAAYIVAALGVQQFHLSEAWKDAGPEIGGRPDILTPLLCKDETRLPEGCYPMIFADDPDIAGALGYHSVGNGGKYYARIFVDLLLAMGAWNEAVSSCASHEYLETCLNATCLLGVMGPKRPEGSRYQKEASDPVQGDSYHTRVRRGFFNETLALSNFVLPAYFNQSTPKGAPVDYLGTCPGPFQLAPGGYMLVGDGTSAPSPVFGEVPPAAEIMAYRALGRRIYGGASRPAQS